VKNTNLILIISVLLLSACKAPRYIYSPALPDQAFLEKKGDSKLAGYYAGGVSSTGASRSALGYEVQAAYAVTNHWAVLLGHGARREHDFYSKFSGFDDYYYLESDVRYKRRMTDIGLGYFTSVGADRLVYLGINGGVGFGNMTMVEQGKALDSSDFSRSYESRLNRLFFTPFINLHTSDNFKLSLSGRFSFVRFREEKNDYLQSEIDYLELATVKNKTQAYWEPALQAQYVFRQAPYLRLEAGFQFCTDKSYALQSRSITGFLGLSFDLTKISSGR
jgi:hypothetical protein